MNNNNKILIGAGVAAAAAAAGLVFLYGTDAGKKTRKQIKSWTLKMKADVMDQMENMKDLSQDAYNNVVDAVAKKYEMLKQIDKAELADLVKDLKGHWRTIQSHVEGGGKKKSAKKSLAKK